MKKIIHHESPCVPPEDIPAGAEPGSPEWKKQEAAKKTLRAEALKARKTFTKIKDRRRELSIKANVAHKDARESSSNQTNLELD
ncbi:hypothetical protein ACFL1Y_00770 [Patescibacteria group bacterium]